MFHSQGPAADKFLSPSLLCVRGTNSFRVSFELDRSMPRAAENNIKNKAVLVRLDILQAYCLLLYLIIFISRRCVVISRLSA